MPTALPAKTTLNGADNPTTAQMKTALGQLHDNLSEDQTRTAGLVNGVLTAAAGTAATPSLTTTGDANTGVYFPAAGTVAIATGGVKRVEVDANGNVGVGVTPSAWGTYNKVLQVRNAALSNNDSVDALLSLSNNCYRDNASGWKYNNSGYAATLYQQGFTDSGHYWFTAPSGSAGNPITFTQAMTLDANGNLGIATTSPTSKLHVKGSFRIESEGAQWFSMGAGASGASYGAFYRGGTTASVGFIGTDGGGIIGGGTGDNFGIRAESALILAAGATERARITSDGNLLVGTTGADPIGGRYNGVVLGSGGNLDIRHASNTSDWGISSTSGTIVNFYSDNGSAAVFAGFISVNGNTTSYASVSDYRLKENIQPMTGALAKVAQLKPCTYNWKADGSDGQGFIAHELQAVFPDAVTGEKDAVDAEGNPKYQGIDTSFLVATLTAALQEAHGLIKDLQSRVDALEAK